MLKTQRIERCIGCGRNAGILTPSNEFGLNQIFEATQKFIENPPDGDDACFSLCTNMTMVDDNAGMVYCLCADCCKSVLEHVLRSLIKDRKKILFQKFDEIKEKLQNV